MAFSQGNLFVDGFYGKVGGNMVFRRKRSGKLVVAKNQRPSDGPPSEVQLNIRQRFREGIIYGTAVMKDPELKAMYAAAVRGDQSAYNLAVRDAFKAPEIKSVNTDAYSGQPGSIVTTRVIDDFKVVAVKVSIFSPQGALIENGDAVLEINGLDWSYTATTANDAVAGSRIQILALDTPGNESFLETTL